MVAKYRYVFSSMRTEQVIQEIDLYGVYLSLALNDQGGQFDGTFQLDQTGKRNEDLIAATEPGRTFVAVERNDVPIGAWMIRSRVYSAQSKTFQMHGASFDAYPRFQRVLSNLTFNNVEQRNIFRTLWTGMQSVAGRNVNVIVPGSFATVNTKTTEVKTEDIRYYSEVMSSIANAEDGFDWYVAVTKFGNLYRKNLLIGYPTLGSPFGPNSLVFEYPGNITQYYMTESMADAGTHILVLGAGEGADMKQASFSHTDLIDQGMPRWDVDIARKDVNEQPLLNSIANILGKVHRAPMLTTKVTVKGDAVPEFGSFGLGDTCKLVFKDPRNPFGLQLVTRIIQWRVRPPTSEQVEEADLIFVGDDPV